MPGPCPRQPRPRPPAPRGPPLRGAVLEQLPVQPDDGVLLPPPLDLVPGPVVLGIAEVMAAITVGDGLDEGRPRSRAEGPHRLGGCGSHLQGVHAVDRDALDPVGRSPGADLRHRHELLHGHGLAVLVVLADVEHRQLPQGGEVEALVERTSVGGAVAEEAHRDPSLLLPLRGEAETGRVAHPAAHDGAAEEVVRRVHPLHRAAETVARPAHPAEHLAEDGLHCRALGQRVALRPVRGDDVVVGPKRGRDPRGNGLLTHVGVEAVHDEVLQLQGHQPVVDRAQLQHGAVQFQHGLPAKRHATPPWERRSPAAGLPPAPRWEGAG